ncbi:hypothetical protein RHSIM_Rhsim12G0135200 [Rhododendron simsii]|uniref:Protein FAR1-RELATED SEQUENCE n=1 Tax=Rhododendron simsii TaxID=118357 RepID=A0A834L5R6_RHOSS|nr:hypothetical protein RHSIM_Rhsim12G0135200 [Rhododendron simsii]
MLSSADPPIPFSTPQLEKRLLELESKCKEVGYTHSPLCATLFLPVSMTITFFSPTIKSSLEKLKKGIDIRAPRITSGAPSYNALMEGKTQDVGGFEPDFIDEDFAEINAIINLAATSNFEEISEFYKSSEGVNYADNARDSGSVEKKMLSDAECGSLLEEKFSTRDELLDRIRNMALKEGYVTTIKKSIPGCYVIIGCDRGGTYRGTSVPLSEGKRISGSRLVINCPFQMLAKKKVANILCVWHIEKNVLSRCKPKFEREQDWETFLSDWTNLVESPDESCFTEAWQRLQVNYEEKECVLNYIKNTWLPFKEKFVKAWTGNHLHFGNRVTSRAEGVHAMLKSYLTVSTGNFHEVREKICLAIENQHNEIKTTASEKLRVIHKFQISMFKELVTHVSIFALSELLKQYELATSSLLDPCRSQFSNTMGLPCAHFMQNMRGEPLLLNDIHPQWRIDIRSFNMDGGVNINGSDIESLLKKFHDKYKCMPLDQREDSHKQIAQLIDAEIPLTVEPTIQPHKGRPSGSKKRKRDSSTTRDPSAFEIAKKTRKCRVCHHVGHNRSTCQRWAENPSLSRLCYRRLWGSRNRRALILGWAYYLDAFSSYPLRTWLPSVYRGHDNWYTRGPGTRYPFVEGRSSFSWEYGMGYFGAVAPEGKKEDGATARSMEADIVALRGERVRPVEVSARQEMETQETKIVEGKKFQLTPRRGQIKAGQRRRGMQLEWEERINQRGKARVEERVEAQPQ